MHTQVKKIAKGLKILFIMTLIGTGLGRFYYLWSFINADTNLSDIVSKEISGGHNGWSYRAGHAAGVFVKKVGEVVGLIASVIGFLA